MGFLSGLFHSRDKPTNSTNGSAYRFLFGGSNSGKAVNERSAMQMTAVYACVRILSESIAGLPVHVYKYTDQMYRVRKTWSDSKSQLGAYKILANAKKKADENAGYKVFDASGNVVYPTAAKPTQTPDANTSYKIQIDIANLNIRKGPGTNYGKTGQFTGKGIFTIVQESKGEGATLWGKLKSGAGWISLDFAKKI